jgi:hypothetical protein
MSATIDLPPETPPSQALTKIERHESAVGKALTVSEMTDRLRLIKAVMEENMTVDVDYGLVPGCGNRPGLFQPGAQKLSMMFQLSPEVQQETVSEFDNYHRGYRLVVRVSNGSKFADGVGECSTLESKYRYRNAGRICPKCHKEAVIEGKPEYGGGYVCYTKKGGCGEKFKTGSELGKKIAEQVGGKVENENPADHWNTVRKMAFKRAFVHAIINATNTSELWSQDLEDLQANGVTREEAPRQPNNSGTTKQETRREVAGPSRMGEAGRRPPEPATGTLVKPAKQTVYATKESRMRFLNFLNAAPGQDGETMFKQFCIAAGMILDTEEPSDLPLQYVPINQRQTELFNAAISDFEAGGDAVKPFVNALEGSGAGSDKPERQPERPTPKAARGSTEPEPAAAPSDDEWFMSVVCPVPRKGMKRDQYLTNPDSIGSMYEARHDDEYLRKRLFGLMNNFVPEGWIKRDGTKMPASEADIEFRDALDAFADWAQKKGERI